MAALSSLSPEIHRLLIRVCLLTTLFELLKVIPPALFKEVIDHLTNSAPLLQNDNTLLFLLLGYLCSLFFMNLLDLAGEYVVSRGIVGSEMDVLRRTFLKLLSLDVAYHEQHETGRSINRLLKGQSRVNELLWHLTLTLLPALAQCLITLAILFTIGWQIGLVFLFSVPCFLLLMIIGARRTQPLREAYYGYQDQFAGSVIQSLANVRTVKDFHAEDWELAKADQHLDRYRETFTKRLNVGLSHLLLEDCVISLARVLTLAAGVWLFLGSALSTGTLVFIMTLSEKAYLTLMRIYRVYFFVQDAEPAVQQFHEILRQTPSVSAPLTSPHRLSDGRVEFREVTYTYSGRSLEALTNLSFVVPARQTAAFVGRSGSGKTTLVKLLLRHFDPQSGTILIDDSPIQHLTRESLSHGVAVVSQDVELFNDSILANLTYGLTDIPMAEVEAVARVAHAHEFIMQYDQGYQTLIGERGVKLSGGQKQRLAIARALLRRPKILIFDEATSSLDAESERFIQEAIISLVGKITLIIIAHRFSTIEHADCIFLVDRGTIRETGTHQELIQQRGIFFQLREMQRLGDVV